METDHAGPSIAHCRACRPAEKVAGSYAEAVRQHEAGVGLTEARARVGETMRVDPESWWWSPVEVRWLVDQWTLFHPDLARLERFGDELVWHRPVSMRAADDFRAAVMWWVLDSPRILRVVTAFLAVYAYAFGAGWMSA